MLPTVEFTDVIKHNSSSVGLFYVVNLFGGRLLNPCLTTPQQLLIVVNVDADVFIGKLDFQYALEMHLDIVSLTHYVLFSSLLQIYDYISFWNTSAWISRLTSHHGPQKWKHYITNGQLELRFTKSWLIELQSMQHDNVDIIWP